ncbi:MAG TPA: hypothetical protein VF329_04885 [Gammaproteobacteria bacterium]
MDTSKLFASAMLALLLGISFPAAAQDWSLVLNGKSIHVNSSKDWNEQNWGLGIEREFDAGSRWVKVALFNGFVDSADEMSYMAGGGLKRRFRLSSLHEGLFVDVGVVGFLMTRQDVNDNEPFPGLLPALTFGTRSVALNLTYLSQSMMDSATNVTRVDPTVSGLVFLQLKLDPRLLFGFADKRIRMASAD